MNSKETSGRHEMRKGFSAAWWLLLFLILWLGWALRWPHLDARPMHGDEAVHALKLRDVLQSDYRYDPQEYHGPSLYYLTLPVLKFFGARDIAQIDESALRIVPLLAGLTLIAFLPAVQNGLTRIGVLIAALLTATSPAMVFYSRYYIQEMLLVAVSFFLVAALWQAVRTRKIIWMLIGGLALGFMHATKETDVLVVFAIIFATVGVICWTKLVDARQILWARWLQAKFWTPFALTALLVSTALLSNFFTHWRGPLDSVLTYANYFHRAGDSAHTQPWHYYLSTLIYFKNAPGPWWSEAIIVILAVVGSVFALRKTCTESKTLPRFLVFYSFTLITIYALIPYKTPWCMLGFLHGLILLAGYGGAMLLRVLPDAGRVVFGLLLAMGVSHLAMQAQAATGRFETDRRNPYVYAHTTSDLAQLGKQLDALAQFHPDGRKMRIHIVAPDAWPLPWYLRRYDENSVGYWNDLSDAELRRNLDAPVVITTFAMQNQVRKLLKGSYHQQVHSQRPQVFLSVFVEQSLWNRFLQSKTERP
jgi:uncharacterized protein (TIGR03663 family)